MSGIIFLVLSLGLGGFLFKSLSDKGMAVRILLALIPVVSTLFLGILGFLIGAAITAVIYKSMA